MLRPHCPMRKLAGLCSRFMAKYHSKTAEALKMRPSTSSRYLRGGRATQQPILALPQVRGQESLFWTLTRQKDTLASKSFKQSTLPSRIPDGAEQPIKDS